MIECNVEWYLEGGQLSVHVFPFRSFIFSGDVEFGPVAPFIAGVCCLNVLLAQNKDMEVVFKSKQPLPSKFQRFAEDIRSVSSDRFDLMFENTAEMFLPKNENIPVLLFSGGKDSLWQFNEMKKGGEKFLVLFVSGSAIAGEYRQELKSIHSMNLECQINTVHVDYIDYEDVSMAFKYRARWKTIMLITLARLFSSDIRIGVSPQELKSEADNLMFYSERPQSMANYRSCYSPDVICDPKKDFINSCWKCRTLHIYEKFADGAAMTPGETEYFHSEFWMGDDHEMMDRMLKLHTGDIPPMKMLQFARWVRGDSMSEIEKMCKD
jgi:hypothetical protein